MLPKCVTILIIKPFDCNRKGYMAHPPYWIVKIIRDFWLLRDFSFLYRIKIETVFCGLLIVMDDYKKLHNSILSSWEHFEYIA